MLLRCCFALQASLITTRFKEQPQTLHTLRRRYVFGVRAGTISQVEGVLGTVVLDAPRFEIVTEATVQERTLVPSNTPSNILLNCFFQVQVHQQPPMSMNVIQRLLRLPAERVMRCRPLLRHPLRFPSHLRGSHSFRLTGPLVCPGFANRSATARV